MNVILFDQMILSSLDDVNNGGLIRKYFSQKYLKSVGCNLILIKKIKDIYSYISYICKKDTVFWLHYPASKKLMVMAISLSCICRKKIILTIHDAPIEQRVGVSKSQYNFYEKFIIKFMEQFLLIRSNPLIFATPTLMEYFKLSGQKKFVMPPGIGEDEIKIIKDNVSNEKKVGCKKKALYFGSMMRSGAIEHLKETFSMMSNWELVLVGPLEGLKFPDDHYPNNVIYLGQKNHKEILSLFHEVDVILIPYPQNEYLNMSMPIKLGYAFSSCKPIISVPLKGIKDYTSLVELENNIYYINNFFDSKKLFSLLEKATSKPIDKEYTLHQMSNMIWEKRFGEIFQSTDISKNPEISDAKKVTVV